MSSALAELLGESLVHRDGTTSPATSALAGLDYVLLYFSASWCPPCKRFTPMLGDYLKAHGAAKRFGVVFVSGDRDPASFEAYFAHHAWDLAVPFTASRTIAALNQKYKITGIPSLIILDAAGELVTRDAVQDVATDAAGAGFPYKPQGVWELLGEASGFTDASGGTVTLEELRASSDVLGLYFSASWCGPCVGFTPKLAQWYTATRAAAAAGSGKPSLDIVFVSSDRSDDSYNAYRAKMPWKAMPLAHTSVKERLSRLFDVSGIPTLIFLRRDGSVLTASGREKVESAPDAFPWPPAPVEPLEAAGEYINDTPVIVLFTDKMTDAGAEAAAVAAFTAVAAAHFAAAGNRPPEGIRFAIAGEGDALAEQVRKFLGPAHTRDKDGAESARVTVVDVQAGRKAVLDGGALGVPTEAGVRALVDAFLAGTAELLPIKA